MDFTIASWNVHMALHNDGGTNDVAAHCARLCTDHGADVIALQEAWDYGRAESTLTRDVAEACGGELYEYTWPARVHKHPSKWTIAIISRVAAEPLDHVAVSTAFGPDRIALRIRLQESDIAVTAAHLDGVHALRSPASFLRQRREFADLAKDTDVMVGDFNMWSPVVRFDARTLQSAVTGPTWPARRPHSQIDHILINDRVEVLSSQVLPDLGSDHRPVIARLRVLDR